ncbi:solute carrier organic anion transporter family member 1C1-like [Rana temporaria]|uniref:solute carrier organic anion transporter family member 1C1-like n=1 Tax=Rana temporaria TaxID=8407 RepID=UPI001AADCCFD|nr:solute carrier organic anion transporter family member 1C1-like [Rana temporaria]
MDQMRDDQRLLFEGLLITLANKVCMLNSMCVLSSCENDPEHGIMEHVVRDEEGTLLVGPIWTTGKSDKMAAEKDDNEQSNLNTNPASMEQNELPGNQKSWCCSMSKVFLAALSFTYFAKAFSGSYMKSSITQIERRFDLSSSTVGMVDGSFEIGNLLVIAIVSYFGAKLHRPRIIAAGCLLMSLGSFVITMPHFFMGPYKYESTWTHPTLSLSNITGSVSPCTATQIPPNMGKKSSGTLLNECQRGTSETNYMWVYILIGNILRGIGETPITPLGISYIDDFASTENTGLYLALLHAVGLLGMIVGFTLSSFFAKLYVDVGFVDMDEVTISPQDTRWVGAWWMGFLVAGMIHLLSAIPFCFLPKNMKKPEVQKSADLLIFKENEKLEPQKKATMKEKFNLDRGKPDESKKEEEERRSSFLEWVVRDVAGVSSIIHYLDDFLCIGPAASRIAAILLATLEHMAERFGVPLSPEKTEGPSTEMTFLGITLDSMAMECRLPEDKLEAMKAEIRGMLGVRKVKLRALQSLLGFHLALKKLACNHLYILLMGIALLRLNSIIGFITYKPKYMEQQYGQSISRSNFINGVSILPAAATGMFFGGLIMKKYKFGLLSASKMSFVTTFVSLITFLSLFIIGCENHDVAGITVTYNGSKVDIFGERSLFSSCNSECHCSSSWWDPVCGENKVTYMSACLAGCKSSSGAGKAVVYHNCSCIESLGFSSANLSVMLGVCPPTENCASMFVNYIILLSFITFINAISLSAFFVIILWSVSPELKSLGIGIYMLLVRTLAGIPAPIYFGALLDKTCLKWGTKFCGGKGACRMYDTKSYRNTFLGLTAGINALCIMLFIWYIFMVKKRASKKSPENGAQQENGSTKKKEHTEDATKDECAALEVEKESCM